MQSALFDRQKSIAYAKLIMFVTTDGKVTPQEDRQLVNLCEIVSPIVSIAPAVLSNKYLSAGEKRGIVISCISHAYESEHSDIFWEVHKFLTQCHWDHETEPLECVTGAIDWETKVRSHEG